MHNYAEWEMLIGRAISRFGDIELISIKCLYSIPRESLSSSTARLTFSQRVGILVEILTGRGNIDTDVQNLLVGLKRARDLSATRNLIAHNPVMLDLYTNPSSDDIRPDYSIISARAGNIALTLDQLKEFVAEVEDLSAELWRSFILVTGCSDHLWRNSAENARN